MFQPGDVVKLLPKFDINTTWTVIDRKDHKHGQSLNYSLFLVSDKDGSHQVSRHPENFELVEPAYMPYDPNQQEDLDSDI